MAMLDALPTWARDLVLMLAAALLGWAGTDLVPILHDQGGTAAVVAPIIVGVINALTPQLTRAYGLGRRPAGDAQDVTDGPSAD
jgi:hypothetical protein